MLMPMVPPGSESILMMDTQFQVNLPSNQTRHIHLLAELTTTQLACFKRLKVTSELPEDTVPLDFPKAAGTETYRY